MILIATEDEEIFEALGAGTRTDVTYEAYERQPTNVFVVHSIAIGLEECVIFNESTPDNVIRYVVMEHNDFHKGSPSTYVQAYPWVKIIGSHHHDRLVALSLVVMIHVDSTPILPSLIH